MIDTWNKKLKQMDMFKKLIVTWAKKCAQAIQRREKYKHEKQAISVVKEKCKLNNSEILVGYCFCSLDNQEKA